MGKRKTNKPKKIQPTPTPRPPIIYTFPSDFMCIGNYAISDVRHFFPYDEEYIKNLELSDVIMEIADDLAQGCKFSPDDPPSKEKEKWETKYIHHTRYSK